MKFNLTKGNVTLTSETQEEALQLFSLVTKTVEPRKYVRKHKKHNFIKQCEFCGKGFKGKLGLGIHKANCKKRPLAKPMEEIWK
jgi:hypothetical protein